MAEIVEASAGELALWACVAEVLAPKAGNVHPGASFRDTSWTDFVVSAVAVRPHLEQVAEAGLGLSVLRCVRDTRCACGVNANLGIVLLLAPLCAVPRSERLEDGIGPVLAGLTAADTAAVYEAIRLAAPGGLGEVGAGDVRRPPQSGLVEAMAMAAGRDAIARQYASGFADVLGVILPQLVTWHQRGWPLDRAIVAAHLHQMAREPDSLIRRKCGEAVAAESARRAAAAIEAGAADPPGEGPFEAMTDAAGEAFEDLDAWLRADGHRRNPGSSADLVCAAVFAAMRDHGVAPPWAWTSTLADLA